jgi:hypothetical protein
MRPLILALVAALMLGATTPAQPLCSPDSYVNSSGHCVRRPIRSDQPPPGATARCRDRTWSFSEHHQGTCSHHGGVATWL